MSQFIAELPRSSSLRYGAFWEVALLLGDLSHACFSAAAPSWAWFVPGGCAAAAAAAAQGSHGGYVLPHHMEFHFAGI